MTYYDIQTSILVTTRQGIIISIVRYPNFVYDHKIEMEDRNLYGRIGTAFHSGICDTQLVSYLNTRSLIRYPSPVKTDTAKYYSSCDKVPDLEEIKNINMIPFFTSNIDIMPVLGYVIEKEHIRGYNTSMFEQPCLLDGEAAIEVTEGLEGDNLGQMVQLLTQGKIVYNSIFESCFKNFFYNRTLSLLPLKGQDQHTVLMSKSSFRSYFKDVNPVLSKLSESTEINLECDANIFGFDNINVYSGNQPFLLSAFFGFLRYFTKAQVDFLYSYPGKLSNIVCGYNKIVVEK